jgi:hypothetical protein
MHEHKRIRPIALTIISGTSVTITIPPQFLKPGKHLDLDFCLSEPDIVQFRDLIEGNEAVTIMNGVGGIVYILENSLADIFYADRLHIGYCYRLRWSNNGPANQTGTTGLIGHFLNLNTPKCARGFNPANTMIPPVDNFTPSLS